MQSKVATISHRYTNIRKFLSFPKKSIFFDIYNNHKELLSPAGRNLACELRRISGCHLIPPKNNVCEPEPGDDFCEITFENDFCFSLANQIPW